jgi:hypothetical protein
MLKSIPHAFLKNSKKHHRGIRNQGLNPSRNLYKDVEKSVRNPGQPFQDEIYAKDRQMDSKYTF